MKRVKFIALLLILALCLVGAGYAAWTDVAVIDATVSTGNVDVKFVSLAVWGAGPQGTDPYMVGGHSGTGTKVASFWVEKMYPGAPASFAMFLQNDGDIPLKLDQVNFNITASDSGILEYLGATVKARKKLAGAQWDTIIGEETGRLVDLDDLIKAAVPADFVLYPGDQIRFGTEEGPNSIVIWLDDETPNEYQNQSFEFDVELNWKQWNL